MNELFAIYSTDFIIDFIKSEFDLLASVKIS